MICFLQKWIFSKRAKEFEDLVVGSTTNLLETLSILLLTEKSVCNVQDFNNFDEWYLLEILNLDLYTTDDLDIFFTPSEELVQSYCNTRLPNVRCPLELAFVTESQIISIIQKLKTVI